MTIHYPTLEHPFTLCRTSFPYPRPDGSVLRTSRRWTEVTCLECGQLKGTEKKEVLFMELSTKERLDQVVRIAREVTADGNSLVCASEYKANRHPFSLLKEAAWSAQLDGFVRTKADNLPCMHEGDCECLEEKIKRLESDLQWWAEEHEPEAIRVATDHLTAALTVTQRQLERVKVEKELSDRAVESLGQAMKSLLELHYITKPVTVSPRPRKSLWKRYWEQVNKLFWWMD